MAHFSSSNTCHWGQCTAQATQIVGRHKKTLMGERGPRVVAIILCEEHTTDWLAKYGARLGIKRG